MTNNALEYLLKQEYSMGNGQCPECYGVPESWFPHPLYCTPDTLGHKPDCKLALSILELGGNPLFLGKSELTGKFRFGLRDLKSGEEGTFAECYDMIPDSEPLSQREIESRKKIKDIMNKHLRKLAKITFGDRK